MADGPVPPTSGPPPGWYPDPYGGPGYRWWDGASWTEHVTDAGHDQRFPGVGDLLGELFGVLGGRIGHLFTLAAVFLLPGSVVAGVALSRLFDDLVYDDGTWTGFSGGRAAVAAVAVVVASILVFAYAAALSRQAVAALAGDPEPWSASAMASLRRLPRVLAANLWSWAVVLVAAFAVLVLLALAGGVGAGFGLVLWLAVLVLGWVLLAFVTCAAAVAPAGTAAVRTSVGLARSRLWPLLGRLLLLAALAAALQMGGGVVTAPVTAQAGDPPDDALVVDEDTGEVLRVEMEVLLPDNPAVLGFVLIAGSLVSGASQAVIVVGLALLYRWAGGPVDPALAGGAS